MSIRQSLGSFFQLDNLPGLFEGPHSDEQLSHFNPREAKWSLLCSWLFSVVELCLEWEVMFSRILRHSGMLSVREYPSPTILLTLPNRPPNSQSIYPHIKLNKNNTLTYDHRLQWENVHPVCSATHKPQIGKVVLEWVTIREGLLLYVFLFLLSNRYSGRH